MSEQMSAGKRALLYVFAVLALAVIAWIIFRGTNVFNYAERANDLSQQEIEQVQE